MMHWYCARFTPSRNTALESGSFCKSAFFSPKVSLRQRSESNTIGDWLIQSKKDGKDQESIQSSTTPDPGYQWERPARSHTFVEIHHEIISTVILLPSAESFKKGCCQLQAKVCARSTG